MFYFYFSTVPVNQAIQTFLSEDFSITYVCSAFDSFPAEPLHFDIDFRYTLLISETVFQQEISNFAFYLGEVLIRSYFSLTFTRKARAHHVTIIISDKTQPLLISSYIQQTGQFQIAIKAKWILTSKMVHFISITQARRQKVSKQMQN